jgi:hypothetical protein
MPSHIRIIHSKDFVRATPQGEFDLEASRKLLLDIASTAAVLQDYEVIVDTRHAYSTMSANDLWSLASQLADHRKMFSRKTAILCPLERFDRARFFVFCAERKDLNFRAFTDYEAAMEWLLLDDQMPGKR